ncbi:MAG: UDP-N-acetylmuramoyl-L-alanyl-D-glutamate--2,6-diaminopimelate ligase [Terrimicrobiaceae bacterium]|nr:UDP-N-acetylmuramoyl-L-alanyl-D-glutamate--2,6-diaminopimelate ligase [Terrimicrobiaceae bacterium]
MRLNPLLQSAGIGTILADPEITSLTCDSRQAGPGSLFFGLPGIKADGAEFVAQAFEKGAAAAVVEKAPAVAAGPIVVVPNARLAMSAIASAFHANPSGSLQCLGVTGTNGKTTTAFLMRHLMEAAGRPCGLIGTIKYVVGGEEIGAPRTTPESLELQELLARMRDVGSRAVAMEVSSHALAQSRADHIAFDAAIFTNLTQDHLDYHGSMDAYFEAKAHLFDLLASGTQKKGRAIINADDRYGHRLIERCAKTVKTITYGRGALADFRASAIRAEGAGTTFQLDARGKSFLVRLPLIGLFNVYNALGALAAVTTCGIELRASIAALADAPQVPGRLQRVPAKRNFHVYVDYAHTDDALRNVLRTLRELQPARLITVFGCGGDRDRAKRPLMAAAAEELSDWTVVTSDNPRREEPEQIIADVKTGLRGNRFEAITDRESAIRRAIEMAAAGDIVLIAGKGHETYQEFADRRIPFDDAAIAARAIADKRIET